MTSSRQTPAIAPRPSATDDNASSPSARSKTLNARILKKREADRKCQRMIRERTKSRITYLEEMVEEFKRKDTSGQVDTLMKQLCDARQERDVLAKKVKNIETVLTDGKTGGQAMKSTSDGSPELATAQIPDVRPDMNTFGPDNGQLPDAMEEDRKFVPEVMGTDVLVDNALYRRTSVPLPIDLALDTVPSLESVVDGVRTALPVEAAIAHESSNNPIFPEPDQPCECSTLRQTVTRRTPFNIWRYANEVLSSRFRWPPLLNNVKDQYRDDTPVRVVVEGWEAAERRGPMHPSWQVLKKIDQAIFWRCSHKERLAVLYMMHILFMSHTDPNSDRTRELPKFFWEGLSDLGPHSYAINYFIWPGLRQRFHDNQHRYCTNNFWTIFTRNLRVLWPFEFRDCYTRNVETGLYSISPLFQNRINDMKTWSMGPEIFERWPEFRTDIPSYAGIPAAMTDRYRHDSSASQTARQTITIDEDTPVARRDSQQALEDQSPIVQRDLSMLSSGQFFTDLQLCPTPVEQGFQIHPDMNWHHAMPQQTFIDLNQPTPSNSAAYLSSHT